MGKGKGDYHPIYSIGKTNAERLHCTVRQKVYREAVLDGYLFFDLYQAKQLSTEWMEEYNLRKTHEALNNPTPEEWKKNLLNNETF